MVPRSTLQSRIMSSKLDMEGAWQRGVDPRSSPTSADGAPSIPVQGDFTRLPTNGELAREFIDAAVVDKGPDVMFLIYLPGRLAALACSQSSPCWLGLQQTVYLEHVTHDLDLLIMMMMIMRLVRDGVLAATRYLGTNLLGCYSMKEGLLPFALYSDICHVLCL